MAHELGTVPGTFATHRIGLDVLVHHLVRERKRISREVFVPLIHRPGEAQVDFGEALVKMVSPWREPTATT